MARGPDGEKSIVGITIESLNIETTPLPFSCARDACLAADGSLKKCSSDLHPRKQRQSKCARRRNEECRVLIENRVTVVTFLRNGIRNVLPAARKNPERSFASETSRRSPLQTVQTHSKSLASRTSLLPDAEITTFLEKNGEICFCGSTAAVVYT